MRVRTLAVIGAIAAAAISPGLAEAQMMNSRVSIRYTDNEDFKGRVRAGDAECRANRVVKIFRKTRMGRSLQGRDRTSRRGRYRVHVMNANGRYFAVVKKYDAMGRLVCERDRSPRIRV